MNLPSVRGAPQVVAICFHLFRPSVTTGATGEDRWFQVTRWLVVTWLLSARLPIVAETRVITVISHLPSDGYLSHTMAKLC